MVTTITADQIDQVINDGQFKYLKLTSSDGKEFGGWNATPGALKKKIQSVREHIAKLPTGQYILHFRISPGKTEWKYILNRGTENNGGGLSAAPVIITQPLAELEKFQTLEEWKRQEQRIKDLEKQVEIMQLEQQRQQSIVPVQSQSQSQFLHLSLCRCLFLRQSQRQCRRREVLLRLQL